MAFALARLPQPMPADDLGPLRRREYEALPAEPRCELIFGRFLVSPSPHALHQFVVTLLFRRLDDIAQQHGGLVFVAPLDVHFADHSIVQPDLVYIAAGNKGIIHDWVEGVPDLVVEVLSPGSIRQDRGDKLRLYAEFGVPEYWIVDPQGRQIEFLHNQGGRFVVVLPQGGRYRSAALPESALDLDDLWSQVDVRFPSR